MGYAEQSDWLLHGDIGTSILPANDAAAISYLFKFQYSASISASASIPANVAAHLHLFQVEATASECVVIMSLFV